MKTVEGHQRFIIFIMVEDINIGDLPRDMQHYAKTRTYLEVKDIELFREKLLHMMPQNSIMEFSADINDEKNPGMNRMLKRMSNREVSF